MKTVLVVGLGEVGVRAARQLIDTPGVDRVIVAARRLEHAREVAAALHDGAEPYQLGRDDPFPDDLDAIVTAIPGEADAALAASGRGRRHPVRIRRRPRRHAAFAARARRRGARAIDQRRSPAAGSPPDSPTCSPVTRWARSTRSTSCTSRVGVSPGSESAAEARRAQREEAREWRDGELVHEKHRHAELIWYPDPVGARECELVATGVELLVAANPGAGRVTARLGVPPNKRFTPPGRRDPGAGLGRGARRGVGLAGDRPHLRGLRRDRAHRGGRGHRARRHRRVPGRRAPGVCRRCRPAARSGSGPWSSRCRSSPSSPVAA